MVEEIGIVKGDFGKDYEFVLKNKNYSSYTAKIFFKRSGGGILYSSGDSLTVVATDGDKNTLFTYTVPSGRFGVNASAGNKYYVSIEVKNIGGTLIDTLTNVMMGVEINRKY